MVSKASSLTKGADSPSQLDAMQYHHLLSSHKYKFENKELRTQIAILAKKLAAETLDPLTLESCVSCRLIPLDKNPVKYIGCVLKEDIQLAAGPLQAVTGLQSGAEAAIYSMRCMFEDDRIDAVILVDIRNGGKIIWWKNVIAEGIKFEYLVNENKSWLILKDLGNLPGAQRLFSNAVIKLTTNSQRHLGVAIVLPIFVPNMPQK